MILAVQGLEFSYNSRRVLSDIRFNVQGGELVAILGPNGVGKTTLLKCLNAIHAPSGGSAFVDGHDLCRMAPGEIALKVGYVAQRSEASRLTVFDSVLMGRKPRIRWKVSRRDMEVVDAALKRLGLDGLKLRYIDELSGGEMQKVAIARALVQEPRLLLLDEPTSSLDLKNQVSILHMVKRVVEEHKVAGIMTMHDLNTALRYAHKFLFLKDGAIFAAGTTDQVTAAMVEEVYGLPVELHMVGGHPLVAPGHDPEPSSAAHHHHPGDHDHALPN